MARGASSELEKAADFLVAEKKPSVYIPEWRALTKLEQYTILALFFRESASTWWEIYGMAVAFTVRDMHGIPLMEFNEQLKKIGGLRKLIDKYREKQVVSLPGFKTFTNLLDDFVKAGWVGYRIDGELEPQQQEMMEEDATGRLYYVKKEIVNALRPEIEYSLSVLELGKQRKETLEKADKFRRQLKWNGTTFI